MTAVACLRVDVSAHIAKWPMATLGPLVHKFTVAYLDSRWSWPRRFIPLTDVCFMLTDPRADELDLGELRRLSDDLQTHLFGASSEGEVALLVYEGPQMSVMAFAAMSASTVAEAVADPALLPPGGRLTRIVPAIFVDGRPPVADPAEWEASPEPEADVPPAEPDQPATAWEGAQGIYFIPRQIFFGDAVMYVPQNARSHLSLLDGPEHMPRDPVAFDATCMQIAIRMLAERPKMAMLYMPICFTSLVRPSLRSAYEAMLSQLPLERRGELAASVYDVPRDPAFTGLRQARALLEPHVSVIDLRTSDPGFEIEKLPFESVNSVTLVLPDSEPMVRLSAIRRFAEQLPFFKQRRIWAAVTNVRRRAELEAAQRLHIPFVTGPAVCSPVSNLVGGRAVALDMLPMSMNESRFPRSALHAS